MALTDSASLAQPGILYRHWNRTLHRNIFAVFLRNGEKILDQNLLRNLFDIFPLVQGCIACWCLFVGHAWLLAGTAAWVLRTITVCHILHHGIQWSIASHTLSCGLPPQWCYTLCPLLWCISRTFYSQSCMLACTCLCTQTCTGSPSWWSRKSAPQSCTACMIL